MDYEAHDGDESPRLAPISTSNGYSSHSTSNIVALKQQFDAVSLGTGFGGQHKPTPAGGQGMMDWFMSDDDDDNYSIQSIDDNSHSPFNHEEKQSDIEQAIASIGADLLGLDHIGRDDSFFELGGDSILAVQMVSRLQRMGHSVSVRDLYYKPVLFELAQNVGQHQTIAIPPNRISAGLERITPEHLPLIDLSQSEIDLIAQQVPGDHSNIQDIYALSPLQDGILFHHLMAKTGDTYLVAIPMAFDTKEKMDRFLAAFQQVVDRHDILRTSFVWETLSSPAQVVWREAPLSITELQLNPDQGSVVQQLMEKYDPRSYRIDLTHAPLIRFITAQESDGRWIVVQLQHHLIGDRSTTDLVNVEIQAFIEGRGDTLPAADPYRNLIAHIRLGTSEEEHERFFKKMLAEVDSPSLPFGIADVQVNTNGVSESKRHLPQELNDCLRAQAKKLGVSLASICHLAWALVVARTSDQERVVFGTVLFGRMQASTSSDQTMGLFVNSLPILLDVSQGTSVVDSVRETHARLAALLEHEQAPLALAQRCSGVSADLPLFSSLLNYRHTTATPASGDATGTGISGMTLLESREFTNYPMTIAVEDYGHSLGLTALTSQPIEAERVCGYMQHALEGLVRALDHTAPASAATVADLQIVPAEERALLVDTWNTPQEGELLDICIHRMFEQQVERTLKATAIIYNDLIMTYEEVNMRANQLAHQLVKLGVKPESFVGICVERSVEMIISILAVMKAGGAYVPLDPSSAAERLRDILLDAAPICLVADRKGREVLGEDFLETVPVVDPTAKRPQSLPSSNVEVPQLTPRHLAYVIYTSGTTGKPKGVMVEHRSFVNMIAASQAAFGFDAHSRSTQFFALSFDASAYDIFCALCLGGTLHLLQDKVRQDKQRLWKYIEQYKITHLTVTPSVLQDCSDLWVIETPFTIILAAEALPPSLVRSMQQLAPNATIFNGYGPTETTVAATYYEIPAGGCGDIVPIGRPMTDKRFYILDAQHRPAPLGVVGEMYIGGVGVTRGYLNRSELTAERYLPDPFVDDAEARMYKTGDLARYLPDGNMLFMGRNDHHVKIRGFRIEFGEIEACLTKHPMVSDAVVLATGEVSNKRLVAYVIAREKQTSENSSPLPLMLRNHLKSLLPEYMVPSAFMRMDSFRLTSNGKLDRQALPEPTDEAFAREEYEEPQGEIEKALASIWADLLRLDRVSRHDSFFALGGHSLLAVQMISKLGSLGHSLSVRALFETPVLSALAQSVGQHEDMAIPPNRITESVDRITPDLLPLIDLSQSEIDYIAQQVPGGHSNIQDIYGLSPLQEGILFHHVIASSSAADPYMLYMSMSFGTRESLDNYFTAMQQIVNRYDILRTSFVWKEISSSVQVVWREAPLSITELQLDLAHGPVAKQLKEKFDPRNYRLDLAKAPLVRFIATQDQNTGDWVLVQLQHHLIGDHSTLELMNSEIQAILEGQEHTLPQPEPYRNLIAQVRLGAKEAEHERFFKTMLTDVDTPSLPYGMAVTHADSTMMTESHQALPQELNDRLRSQAKRLGVSLASICHLAWAMVIAQTSGQERVVFGTVLLGRMQASTSSSQTMGLFINTLPVLVDVDSQRSVDRSVKETHARLAALLEHELASLALAQRCSSVPA
ncbi:hypothetical protein BGX33_000569, partial [Mortierella sp. NVP41]